MFRFQVEKDKDEYVNISVNCFPVMEWQSDPHINRKREIIIP